MTETAKSWIARLVSVPVLLFLPLICCGIGFVTAEEHRGDSLPLFGLLGLATGLALAAFFAAMTTFGQKRTSATCFRIITAIALAEVVAWLVLRFAGNE